VPTAELLPTKTLFLPNKRQQLRQCSALVMIDDRVWACGFGGGFSKEVSVIYNALPAVDERDARASHCY